MSLKDSAVSGKDAAWLASWIAPIHLKGKDLQGYREAFEAHPARLVVIPAFLDGEIAGRVAHFLEREAEYRPAGDRVFRFSAVSGVQPQFRLGANAVTYLKIVRALEDDRFVRFAETISGLPLGSVHLHVHAMSPGDFLPAHTDAHDGRRLTFVLFLSRAWHSSFGGVLHLTTADGGHWAIEPAYNTLVMFDVDAHGEHWVTPIEAAAGHVTRVTIGGWIENRPVQ